MSMERSSVSSGPRSIISEIGETHRQERSLKHRSGSISRNNNIVSEMPSRSLGFLLEGVDCTDGNTENGNISVQAEKIALHLEKDPDLMDDTAKSVIGRMETLREMPQSLALKRSVRGKLKQTVKSRSRTVSFFDRATYNCKFAFFKFKEDFNNWQVRIELWYRLLKNIEGQFGSGVASYFKFLRSLFIINSLVFIISLLFVVVPQIIKVSIGNSTKSTETFRFGNIFTGEGYFSESVLFYGYYSNETLSSGTFSYNLPSAYFFSALASYFLVFILLSINMAVSFRKNFIEGAVSGNNSFANKILCSWDFGIAAEEAAALKSRSIYTELKEMLEELRGPRRQRNWLEKAYNVLMQIGLNLFLLGCVGAGSYFTWKFLISLKETDTPTSMMISLVLTIIIHIAPVFLSWLLRFEDYDSLRIATYVTLARTFVLDAAVIGVLVAYRLHTAEGSNLCWETAIGQEVYRLVLLDFLVGLVGTSLAELVRYRLFLTILPGIGCPEVDIARNTISLLYNQTLFYVGLYFSPVLSLVIILKLFLTFYVKYYSVINNCKPSERMWRAAQTETVFLTTAFTAFLGVLILYGYILSSVRTSNCGPFRGNNIMYESVITLLSNADNTSVGISILLYIRKPGVVAVFLIAMLLTVYYLRAVGRARGRVVRILTDILHLQAKDKEYLLQHLNKISKLSVKEDWMSPSSSAIYGSYQDVRISQSKRKPDVKRWQSLFDVTNETQELINAESSAGRDVVDVSRRKLAFNPIFDESSPPHRSRESSRLRLNGDLDIDGNRTIDDSVGNKAPYTPLSYDDKVPSRIGFPERNSKRRPKLYEY